VGLILTYLGSGLLLCVGLVPMDLRQPQDESWDVLWHALAEELSPLERARLVSVWERRLNVRAAEGDPQEVYLRQLARNALGLEARSLSLPSPTYLGTPGEAWIAARFRPQDRVQLMVHGLQDEGLTPEQGQHRLQSGFEVFLALEGEWNADALLVAQALHLRAQAPWSAFCLEGIQRRLGHLDQALETIDQMLAPVSAARGPVWQSLMGRRAIIHAGAGHRDLALADLGRLLSSGAADAHQILGLDALLDRQWQVSSAHFGVLLDSDRRSGEPHPPWALRGYGVSLLPR